MILRQILQLDITARKATCAIGSIKLEHTTGPTICTYGLFHCLIFANRGFRQLLAQGQDLAKLWWRSFQKFCHSLFIQAVRGHDVFGQPLLHLLDGVRIFQRCDTLHGSGQFFTGTVVHFHCLLYQLQVEPYTCVIYLLVKVVFIPDHFRHREFVKTLLDAPFGFHITDIVALEVGPFLWCMKRPITGAFSIGFRRSAGLAEIFDEVFALRELLLFKTKHGTNTLQG